MSNVIGVFFGSRSPEHDISILTAQVVIAGLKKNGHEVLPVYISKKGDWYCSPEMSSIAFFADPNKLDDKLKKLPNLNLDLKMSKKLILKEDKLFGKEYAIDIAFPCFHGKYGEDGTIQGIFELLNIPFVGCDVASSALAMNKVLTKRICISKNIPTPKFVNFSKFEYISDKAKCFEKAISELKLPVFVKPPTLGSSIGINKVSEWTELENQIDVALYYDTEVLIEEGVPNMVDLTCCVIGHGELISSLIQGSSYTKDFFSYEDKYLKDGGAQTGKDEKSIVIPAPLEDGITTRIQEMSKEVYRTMGCSGIARVDFLFDRETSEFFVNEVNTLPGTIYSHLWEKTGINLSELLEKLLQSAKARYNEVNSVNSIFVSSVLQNATNSKFGGKM
jgi:D-alanine-D-alanine ligase